MCNLALVEASIPRFLSVDTADDGTKIVLKTNAAAIKNYAIAFILLAITVIKIPKTPMNAKEKRRLENSAI